MSHWRPLAVGLLALGLALFGIDARDLTGDEVAIFTGTPWETWVLSLGLDAFFTGHMPLSYWLRWPILEVFGSDTVWAWRLHAAVGFALAAGVTALTPSRWGLAAGMLVALSPVASFHGMESANYAWTIGLGAVVIVALQQPIRHRWWWVAGLALAALNDLYALWLGIGAMVALVMVHRGERERLARPLGVLAVLTVPLVVWVLIRMGVAGEAASVGMHADVASSDSSLWSLWTGRLQRFGGASLLGYAAGRESDFWEQWPSIAPPLVVTVGAIRARAAWARTAGWVLLGGLVSVLVASGVVWLAFGRVLPMEPRVLVGLSPALALCTAATVGSLERGRALVLGIILSVTGTATLVQQLTRSTLHTDAAMFVAAHAEPGDVVVAPERIRTRLLTAGVSQAIRCMEGMPDASQRVWWIQAQPIEQPFAWQACDDARGDHAPVDMTGWRIAQVWTLGPPEHERSAAGFVRPVAVFEWVRASEQAGLAEAELMIRRALLDGLTWSTVETSLLRPDGEYRSLQWFDLGEDEVPVVSMAQPVMSRIEVRARATHWKWLPEWSLLDPFRRDVQAWELMLVDPQMLRAAWVLPAVPLQNPTWQVVRRLLVLTSTLSLLAVALRRRST